MHEDPTRMMSQPDDHKPHGNMRLLIAGLIAVIVGLVVAIAVIASDDGGSGTTSTVTSLPTETTGSRTETTPGSTTETTAPTTTETTAPTTTETTTTTTTAPSEEEDSGSGGIGAP